MSLKIMTIAAGIVLLAAVNTAVYAKMKNR